jgi:hypothetical protein
MQTQNQQETQVLNLWRNIQDEDIKYNVILLLKSLNEKVEESLPSGAEIIKGEARIYINDELSDDELMESAKKNINKQLSNI